MIDVEFSSMILKQRILILFKSKLVDIYMLNLIKYIENQF